MLLRLPTAGLDTPFLTRALPFSVSCDLRGNWWNRWLALAKVSWRALLYLLSELDCFQALFPTLTPELFRSVQTNKPLAVPGCSANWALLDFQANTPGSATVARCTTMKASTGTHAVTDFVSHARRFRICDLPGSRRGLPKPVTSKYWTGLNAPNSTIQKV